MRKIRNEISNVIGEERSNMSICVCEAVDTKRAFIDIAEIEANDYVYNSMGYFYDVLLICFNKNDYIQLIDLIDWNYDY